MKKVVIWTFKFCPFCVKAKALLDQLDIQYEEIMIPFGDKRLEELSQKTNCTTLPQIFVDEVFIGDCSKIHELHEEGLLVAMIKEQQ